MKNQKRKYSLWESLKFAQFILGVYTMIVGFIFLSFYNSITERLLELGGLAWIIITALCWKCEPKSWDDDSENNSNNN
ncbi:MAG: hypothetical protein FWH31_04895 [Streptococcaceae bacterium]|nr:hypothetical protein [Streptococcaceae bacterium]